MLNRIDILGDIYLSNIEIAAYLNDPANTVAHLNFEDGAEVFALINEQLNTDDLVEDSFREALSSDVVDWSPDLETEVDPTLYHELMDLCDIVEASEKGYIIYG